MRFPASSLTHTTALRTSRAHTRCRYGAPTCRPASGLSWPSWMVSTRSSTMRPLACTSSPGRYAVDTHTSGSVSPPSSATSTSVACSQGSSAKVNFCCNVVRSTSATQCSSLGSNSTGRSSYSVRSPILCCTGGGGGGGRRSGGTVEEHTTAASFPPGSGETDMGVCRSAALRAGMSSPYARGGRLATTKLSASANTIPAGQLTLLKGAKASTPGVGLSAAAGCSCSLPSLEGVVRKGVC
mmetsp:Transcript_3071/g.9460  ORF Transcript_3071/g.9460 Transcript_3071/m.9460 type:complete len:240 (-) Transcript_3071:1859-2578(-)